MKTDVQRTTKLMTSIVASVDGVKTLADTECALSSLVNEGVPPGALLGVYADGHNTLRYHMEYDNTSALVALKANLVEYLSDTIKQSGAEKDEDFIECKLLRQLNTVLEGI